MADSVHDFEKAYATGQTPWDSGVPDAELLRVINEGLLPGRTLLEFGCGTGTNAIELTRLGYEVTAVDYVPQALEKAREKARADRIEIDFRLVDLTKDPDLGGPYDVLFDRGVYHHIRRVDLAAFQRVLKRVSRHGTYWLSLAGNAKEKTEFGPPRVHEHEIRAELEPLFEIIELRELRLVTNSADFAPLFWSILMKRKS
jgi:2-polyprenyl-3-methyl-5-hydroxy-6-metoxy-1,4-benzoquinol methylase